MKIKKTKKIIRDSYNSVEDLTSKLNKKINFLYKDFNSYRGDVVRQVKSAVRKGESIIREEGKDLVRQGKATIRKGKSIIRDGEEAVNGVYNKTKTLYKDVQQD